MILRRAALVLGMLVPISAIAAEKTLEETTVIAERLFSDTSLVSPNSRITAEDLQAINLVTAEDAVSYEPSLVIRRRFVGDANGTLGIRGSGMFQTARALVYADGLPLHYLLQTRWSGAPRWSLVGADEIETAEVIYGPYSAEYSGNAMGGVVDIKTRTPQQRRVNIQGMLMAQQYDVLGTDDSFNGNKIFLSYEDKLGDLSLFASYNRLMNQSQPMVNYSLDAAAAAALDTAGVTGYIPGQDEAGNDVVYIGDSGADTSATELYKLKLGYDLGTVQLRGILAYEQRTSDEDDKRNYLLDSNGDTYWGLGSGNFEQRYHERNSLLLGLGISGAIGADWFYDLYATDFAIKKDEEIRTGLNPDDPAFGTDNGRLTAYGPTGWNTLDLKFGTQNLLGNADMRLSVGLFADEYELEVNPWNIDPATGAVVSPRAQSRGTTRTQALFAQWGYALAPQWDLALGLRYEDWQATDGFYNNIAADDRTERGASPKFSLAYSPNDNWRIRYSLARALRFPISEELYRNEEATTSFVVSDPSLAPEDGIFHNLSIDREFDSASVRVNLFYDLIDDSIYNQRGTVNEGGTNVAVSTFLAIDEVETRGLEFVYQQSDLLGSGASLRFNTSYTDASITENAANPAIEGNDLPRIPQWRANLILNYPINDRIDLGTSLRYSSDAFGTLDNSDTQSGVYGAIDSYLFVSAKANWQVNENARLSLGVDNLFDELAYVAHPWPSRTLYLEGKYSF